MYRSLHFLLFFLSPSSLPIRCAPPRIISAHNNHPAILSLAVFYPILSPTHIALVAISLVFLSPFFISRSPAQHTPKYIHPCTQLLMHIWKNKRAHHPSSVLPPLVLSTVHFNSMSRLSPTLCLTKKVQSIPSLCTTTT